MEALVTLWVFATSHGPLAAIGLLCLAGASYWLVKAGISQWRVHADKMEKIDVHYGSIIDPEAKEGVVIPRHELRGGIREVKQIIEERVCVDSCPVMPQIIITLEDVGKQLKAFVEREDKDREAMNKLIAENYEWMNNRMDKSLAERDALLARFLASFEHFIDSERERRRQ